MIKSKEKVGYTISHDNRCNSHHIKRRAALVRLSTLVISLIIFSSSVSFLTIPRYFALNSKEILPSVPTYAAISSFNQLNSSNAGLTVEPAINYSYSPDSTTLEVTLTFNPSGSMSSYLNSIDNPASPVYDHFLNTSEIGAMFGIPAAVYGEISSYFRTQGLSVYSSNSRLSMTLVGNITAIAHAFNTQISPFYMLYNSTGIWIPTFGNQSGEPGHVSRVLFYANTEAAMLPLWMKQYVSGVVGLNTLFPSPSLSLPSGYYPGMDFNFNGSQPLSNSIYENYSTVMYFNNNSFGYLNSTEASSLGLGNSNYQLLFPSTMPALTGARYLWNGSATENGAPDLGQNITVAVIDVGLIPLNLLKQFSEQVFHNASQISSRFTEIPLLGANVADANNSGWMPETALDLEYIATMAPEAHIDLVAVPNPSFAAFDYAYSYIAQYLTSFHNASTSVTVTSNSYGAPEIETILLGSPMYLTAENTLLSELALEGVTNFFASGDTGTGQTAAGAGIPAIASGSTSVGGGQLTAAHDGNPFPQTDVLLNITLNTFSGSKNLTLFISNATGYYHFTYWYYYAGFMAISGGFGLSATLQQPWWQNAYDTYSTGAKIDPVVSGAAAFNMTFYFYGWQPFYGGTSFATPITAGEWALVEEQVNSTTGVRSLGDINPLLYDMHNFVEYTGSLNPFVHMSGAIAGFDASSANYFSWGLYNLSLNLPSDPLLPSWFPSLHNPLGEGWNFLQGLGMLNASIALHTLEGSGASGGYGLLRMPASISMNSSPVIFLRAGITYTFRLDVTGPSGTFLVVAGTGFSGNGSKPAPLYSDFQVNANGTFNYTPIYSGWPINVNNSEYGFFAIHSGSLLVGFQFFAVLPDPVSGNLSVVMDDAYGFQHYNTVNVPMFSLTSTGSPNYVVQAEVLLNGLPVTNAMLVQTAVTVNYSYVDSSLPSIYYTPGSIVSYSLTDQRGEAFVWTDALIAENNGPLPTQVFLLRATYRGLQSNVMTVYVEPQSASFLMKTDISSINGSMNGTLNFNNLKYVNFINISSPQLKGVYFNESFSPSSNTSNGRINFDLGEIPRFESVLNITVFAQGINRESSPYSANLMQYHIIYSSIQDPITWLYELSVKNQYAGRPLISISLANFSAVSGIIDVNYSTSWAPAGSHGMLYLNSSTFNVVLWQGNTLNGSYKLNTSSYPDGLYLLTFEVVAPSGSFSRDTVSLYFDNSISKLTDEVLWFVVIEKNISQLQQKLAALQGEILAKNTTASSLKSQYYSALFLANSTSSDIYQFIHSFGANNTYATTLLGQQSLLNESLRQISIELNSSASSGSSPAVGLFGLPWIFWFGLLLAVTIILIAALLVEIKKNQNKGFKK
jgi:subtilase family serine protease